MNDETDDTLRDPVADPAWITNQIAHALRNQIFAAMVHAEVLQQRAQGDPTLRRGVETLFGQVKRLEATIEEMLLYGREVPVDRSRLRVRELLEELAEEYGRGRRAEPAQVRVDSPADLTAHWDPRSVRVILERLLDNAVQHSPPPHAIELGAVREGADVALDVGDHGEGVEDEVGDRAFLPFFPQHKGRIGLGLAVARKFARALGGEVTLHARPEGGTIARCRLPVGDG